jgi:hypothetical protein
VTFLAIFRNSKTCTTAFEPNRTFNALLWTERGVGFCWALSRSRCWINKLILINTNTEEV